MTTAASEGEAATPVGAGAQAPPAGPHGTGAASRLPFSPIDEVIHLLDAEAAPWSVQLEARVEGRLDPDRLRQAVVSALARHPLARARKRPGRAVERRWEWDVPSEPDLDPVRVVDCRDDEAISVARAELQSLAVPLAEAPPLRVRLAHHPGGDYLMLNVNHAASDGFGCMRLLRSIARAYHGRPDPVPPIDLMETRDLASRLLPPGGRGKVWRLVALAEKLRDVGSPPAHLASEDGADVAGYGFHHVRLSPGRTREVVAAKRGSATVNDLLVTALHLAIGGWNADHGAPADRISVLVPVNLRPPEWSNEIVANVSLPFRVGTGRRDRARPEVALASVAAQTARMKRRGTALALTEVLAVPASLPGWAKRALPALLWLSRDRFVDTAMLSNLGRIAELPTFGSEAGATTELWFSPPARMPLGLSVGAGTAGDALHLVFRYRHRLLGPAAAARFANRYLRTLAAIGG